MIKPAKKVIVAEGDGLFDRLSCLLAVLAQSHYLYKKVIRQFFPQLSYYTFTVLIDEAGGIIFLGCCPSVCVLHAWAETFSIRFVVDFKLMM